MKWLVLILVIIQMPIFSQVVKVMDQNTLQPISHVLVYNKNGSEYTDDEGEATLEKLNMPDSVFFYHSSYKDFGISHPDLLASNYRIILRERLVNMDEIVVSANRWEQNRREVAMKITSISHRENSFNNPQTTADLLATSGDVYIQKSQQGGGSPMIRGFAANRVLIVVDGVRMNNAIYRSGNLQNVISLDANSLQNAEVIFGPGSVIYGSDAIGGVMSFQTLQPVLSNSGQTNFSSEGFGRFSSVNSEQTYHWRLNAGSNRWGIASSVTYSKFDDLQMGANGRDEYLRNNFVSRIDGQDTLLTNDSPEMQVPSGYDQWNASQKIRYRPNLNWDVDLALHYSRTSDVPRYDRLIEFRDGAPRSAEWYYGPQKWWMNALNVRYNRLGKAFDSARLTAAFQDYEESRIDRRFGNLNLRQRVEEVKVYSLNLDLDKKLNANNSLYYGSEFVHNRIGSSGEQENIESGELTPVSSRYPDDSQYSSYAAYAKLKSNFHLNHTFLAGIRYSRISLTADFDDAFFPFPFESLDIRTGALNGSLGWVYRPSDRWQVNLNAASGFRAPNIDDAGKIFDSEPGNVVVPNESLKPETAYSVDLGFVKRIDDRIRLEATGFFTLLRDAMVRRDFQFNGQDSIVYDGTISRVQAVVNADEATVYGLQTAIRVLLSDQLSFRKHFTWATGEDKDGLPLRHINPFFGSAYLSYQMSKLRADISFNYNGEISNENLAITEQAKTHIYASDENGLPFSPSWFTLNLKAAYQINDKFRLHGGIENILDKRYRPYSSGIVAGGRNFVLAIRRNF